LALDAGDGVGARMIKDPAFWISIASLIVSIISAWFAHRAQRQARKAATLSQRIEAINNIRNALWDVKFDGNITTKTTDSIRDAAHLSTLIFDDAITQTLEAARGISYELENTPSERQTAQYDGRKAELAGKLEAGLELMKKQASLRG
jgi:type II secretory pathway pseudopilin PulG